MKRLLLFFIFLSFFFFFMRCTSLKKEEESAGILKEVDLSSSIEKALAEKSFTKGDWPSYNWWTMFQDQQLSEIMEEAIAENPDLKTAVARLQAVKFEARKAKAPLYPNIDFEVVDDYQHLSKGGLFRFPPSSIPAVINQVDIALKFSYEIDLFKKNLNTYRAALGRAKAEKAEMSESLLMITSMLAETYFDFQANQNRLELQQKVVEQWGSFVFLMEERFSFGLEDKREVDAAITHLLTQKKYLADLEKELALNASMLKILMGKGPNASFKLQKATAYFNEPFPIPDNLPLNLLARRPDLMAKICYVESLAHLIGVAKAAFYPNINLNALAGFENLSWGNLFTPGNFLGSLAPAIHLPVFTGGKLTAALGESRENFKMAVFEYNSLLLKAAKEVADGLKVVSTMDVEKKYQMKIVQNACSTFDLERLRRENGISSNLALIEKELLLLQEKLKEVDLENKRYVSLLYLVKALGGGYVSTQVCQGESK
ncbi:MAG: efflux transporter outer membrane subunit [Simkania negevensis]|nr:efflux transporter outer membrane subunit [Simkania negevensis]